MQNLESYVLGQRESVTDREDKWVLCRLGKAPRENINPVSFVYGDVCRS